MGLDAVELVLRTEEFFALTIADDEASTIGTVSDFYNLVCAKLNVTPLPHPVTPTMLPVITEKQTDRNRTVVTSACIAAERGHDQTACVISSCTAEPLR